MSERPERIEGSGEAAKKEFNCYFHFVGWDCISLGLHLCLSLPNIEVHIPFGFIRIGWCETFKAGDKYYTAKSYLAKIRKEEGEMKNALEYVKTLNQIKDYESKFKWLKQRLSSIARELQETPLPEYTGWYVLLERDRTAVTGFKFKGIYNPDRYEEEEDEPEWDIALPIPTKETIPGERKPLSYEEAVAMLPKGERIHTFRQAGSTMIGANWDREDILAAIKEHGAEISGEVATGMRHGLCLNDGSPLFIETE